MWSHTGCLCMHTSPYIWMPKQVCTWHHVYREDTGQLSKVWFLLLMWDAVWWQSSLSDKRFLTQWTIPQDTVSILTGCKFLTLSPFLVHSWFSNILIFWHQVTLPLPRHRTTKDRESEMKMKDCQKIVTNILLVHFLKMWSLKTKNV